MRSQVDYKLNELITMRAEAPVGTPETLFGDDAESDAFIYALYADVLAGRVGWNTLRKISRRRAPTRIKSMRFRRSGVHHPRGSVRRIIIHLDRRTPPVEFQAFFPLVVPIYSHLQTAIVLCLDDTLSPNAIRDVAYELLTRYGTDEEHHQTGEDIPKTTALELSDRVHRELADGLTATKDAPWAESDTPDEQARTMTSHIIRRIADLALHLKIARTLPMRRPQEPTERDYLEIWANELKRRRSHQAQLRLETKNEKSRTRSQRAEQSVGRKVHAPSRAGAVPQRQIRRLDVLGGHRKALAGLKRGSCWAIFSGAIERL